MLCTEALKTALPLAEKLDRGNIIVRPVAGTPLDRLVTSTRADANFMFSATNGGYEPSIADIEYIANAKSDPLALSNHDIALDQLVELAATGVKNHLLVVRTAVVPAIGELECEVRKRLEEIPTSSLLGMEVKIYDLPIPYKNAAIENLISNNDKVPLEDPALRMKCPDISFEELKDLLHTGARGFDTDIDKWIAVKGESFFLQLWEDLFQTRNNHFAKFVDAMACREEGMDRALAVFLIARKLFDDPITGIQMALPSFKSLAAQYRDQAAGKIARALSEWTQLARTQILVKGVEGRCITVNECVYRPWITAGGDNDVLFGALVKGYNYIAVRQFDENALELKREWNKHVGLTGVVERTNRFLQIKELLFGEFKKQLNGLKEDVEGIDLTAQVRNDLLVAFRKELATFKETDCEDLGTMCLKLQCRTRFKNTGAEDFLMQMKQIEADNPNLPVREVATIATIEYISNWVAEQFQVSAAVV
jgi:hypothetical protein